MQKPSNYDNTRTAAFARPMIGPHKAVIMEVKEMKSSTGRDMIRVSIDFDKDDLQAGLFAKEYKSDTREPDKKKWPNAAVTYILVNSNDGGTNRAFKSFIEAWEDTNGLTCQWGDRFEAQFKNRKIGVMYGDVDEEYNGQIQTRQKIRWFYDLHREEEQVVPNRKAYNSTTVTTSTEEWMNIPDGAGDEGLPFK